ncbi:MAG: lactate utilization protein [Firmicutes bacterium]|nr:lactate utilization protein [Bacillota bacterium]
MVLGPIKAKYDKSGPKVVEALKKRKFDAYYFSTADEAVEKVLELIPEADVVSWGGTMTVDQLGIKEKLAARNQPVLNRDAVPAELRSVVMKQALACDTYLMSSNAITENGELFNIDGFGNRVAALTFGPKSVIVVAGMNKVVADMDAAYSRVRHYVAPANAQRFDISTPCSVTGICADCTSPDCICATMVTTRASMVPQRVKVVLVGEDLGI